MKQARSRLTALAVVSLLLAAWPAAASFQDFGYLGVFKVQRFSGGTLAVSYYGAHIKNATQHDIPATVAAVPTYEGCELSGNTDYLAPADVASVIADFAADGGYKLMLNLQWVIFERTTFPCDPFGPTRLRADWDQRLTTYAQHAAGIYNSSNTAYVIVHSEVNNSPDVHQADVVNAAKRVAQLFPGIPRTAGYPTGTGTGPHPNLYPWPLNIIYTWDYSIPDPRASSYVNGAYAGIVSRLRSNQTVGVLAEGFGGDSTGISGVSLAALARRWCVFAKQQARVEHMAGFFWGENTASQGGTEYIIHQQAASGSTALETAHRAVANAAANQGNGSCWASN